MSKHLGCQLIGTKKGIQSFLLAGFCSVLPDQIIRNYRNEKLSMQQRSTSDNSQCGLTFIVPPDTVKYLAGMLDEAKSRKLNLTLPTRFLNVQDVHVLIPWFAYFVAFLSHVI